MPQISLTVTNQTLQEVKTIAEREKRSLSATAEILLERAIKERNRKKTKND